jgi:hypothetical protein
MSLESLNDDECGRLLRQLFPRGFAGGDVLAELAPEGWQNSPLLQIAHPTVEQVHEETVRMLRNIRSLMPSRKKDAALEAPLPTLQETRAEYQETPVDAESEARDLVARCIWDVFSDNHEVIAPDGRVADLGSFRGSAGFIADLLNEEMGAAQFDYMDFYMGTVWAHGRADLRIVYRMIFRRLKQAGCDWRYEFPRLHVVDLRPLARDLDEKAKPEWQDYSPSAAMQQEQDNAHREKEIEEMQRSLSEAHERAVEEAKTRPPPDTVQAYRDVFGHMPIGWPPSAN